MAKTLRIDTSNNRKITIELEADRKKDTLTEDSTFLRSEATLPTIDKLLEKNKLKIQDVEKVEVESRSGFIHRLKSRSSNR